MTPDTRLIETAFPLKQVSRASVHEKSVRHGHLSTLHIWPARRPLAASRAAVLAALLPAPDGDDARRRLLERMAAVLSWGEEDPAEIERFRAEVRAAFGGRAPRVLDPFAGGGAIPLEAMRLGCEAEAADLNPVAWFLLRCTLHYPRALAGARRPLPGFAVQERAFAEAFLKAQGVRGKAALRAELERLHHGDGEAAQLTAPDLERASPAAEADLAWHLRAWGRRVLARVRRKLAARYPTYAEFEPRRRKGRGRAGSRARRVRYRPREPRLLTPDAEGHVSVAAINAEFDSFYLEQDANPRWVAKPAVAYLWARTVPCRDCRAEIPLLKTGWLCRKGTKRVRLTMTPTADGAAGVALDVEAVGDGARGAAGGAGRGPGGAGRDAEDDAGGALGDRADGGTGVADGARTDDRSTRRASAGPSSADGASTDDRRLGAGTMSRNGASCPVCGSVTTMADLRAAGRAGRLGARLTAVVVDGQQGKEYRPPTADEVAAARVEADDLNALYAEIPFGLPDEPTPKAGVGASRAFSVDGYGFTTWRSLFTDRQLLALGAFVREIRRAAGLNGPTAPSPLSSSAPPSSSPSAPASSSPSPPAVPATALAGDGERPAFDSRAVAPRAMDARAARQPAAEHRPGPRAVDPGVADAARGETPGAGAPFADGDADVWREALAVYLTCAVSKAADYGSAICSWNIGRELVRNTFARFALPIVWDYCEVNPLSETTGGFLAAVEWVARVVEHLETAAAGAPVPAVAQRSAMASADGGPFDLICTDPPYYDAIPYSDLMDFFHVWLRRALRGVSPEVDAAFADPRGPKWDAAAGDGELIDDAARFGGDRAASKRNYEDGMARAFVRFRDALRDDGRLVLVFANKSPDAWETLVSALIRAGFVVTGSWPIQTEMQNKVAGGARLSSSIWLVCRKRPEEARAGWDGKVLAAMEESITARLRGFWDAGIRGPDFVWAATGPALEAFSRHPVVKKADAPGERLTVAEFLRRVRRMVVGFVVSRLLDQRDGATGELDDPTTYYLLHRNDFGLAPAPAGACILYALSCNLSDADLAGRLDLLVRGGRGGDEEEDAETEADAGWAADVAEAAADRGGAVDADAGRADAEATAARNAVDANGRGAGAAGAPTGAAGRASGGEVRLKQWGRRRTRDLGEPAADGAPPPLVDCLHRTMQLWKTGEQRRVDAFLEARGLWRHELFARVTQAIVELAERGSEERALLESIQNHLRTGGGTAPPVAPRFDFGGES